MSVCDVWKPNQLLLCVCVCGYTDACGFKKYNMLSYARDDDKNVPQTVALDNRCCTIYASERWASIVYREGWFWYWNSGEHVVLWRSRRVINKHTECTQKYTKTYINLWTWNINTQFGDRYLIDCKKLCKAEIWSKIYFTCSYVVLEFEFKKKIFYLF